MEDLTPGTFWAVLLTTASAVVLLANAAEKIVKIIKAAKAPNDRQDSRLDDLDAWRRSVDEKLNKDNSRLAAIEEGNRVTQRALIALLDHSLDGNNVSQMKSAKEELQNHLINR